MIKRDFNFLLELDSYIGKAFDNEEEFMKKFCQEDAELVEFTMGFERSRVTYLIESGMHVITSISTADFVEWHNNLLK